MPAPSVAIEEQGLDGDEGIIEAEVVEGESAFHQQSTDDDVFIQADVIEGIEEQSLSIVAEATPREKPCSDVVKKQRTTSGNGLWDDPTVPKTGWTCTDVSDYGPNSDFLCQMCLRRKIRYVHHMAHPDFPRSLDVGCICAGNMEGDVKAAQTREREFKNKQTRRENFHTRKWRISARGSAFINISGHHVVLCQSKFDGRWKYALDGTLCQPNYISRSEAVDAAFEALDKLVKGNK